MHFLTNSTTKRTPCRIKKKKKKKGHDISRAASHRFTTAAARIRSQVRSLRFVVGRTELWEVFSEYFGFALTILISPTVPRLLVPLWLTERERKWG
jgi:hypothetical protein